MDVLACSGSDSIASICRLQTRQLGQRAKHLQFDQYGTASLLTESNGHLGQPSVHMALPEEAKDDSMPEGLHSMLAAKPSGNDAGSAKPGPSDPNTVGFVPAFIAGDVFVCKLPHKYVQQASNHASKHTTFQ